MVRCPQVVHRATGEGGPRLRPVFMAFWVPASALGAGAGRPPEVLACLDTFTQKKNTVMGSFLSCRERESIHRSRA